MCQSKPKMTHAEHTARAMLLGMVYDWRDGTYCHFDPEGDGIGITYLGALDAMTLQPYDCSIEHRIRDWGFISVRHTDPPQPTPYADE